MTSDIRVRIVGSQTYESGETEGPMELITEGKFREMGGKQHIRYDEILEGTDSVTKNHVIMEGDRVEVRKKGTVEVNMIFRVGAYHECVYRTQVGAIPMGIQTHSLRVQQEEDQVRILIQYSLCHQPELKISDNVMEMTFTSLIP